MSFDPQRNNLDRATSPYLLQHAANPVHWQSWSAEVLAYATEQDKPVLVSIGYATCHWCHVMERESFEDPATAALMNELFVCIKVDREERPDVDQVYMEACQAINGSGGWPLNAFLLPNGRPFYAGTYYPPEPKYQRPSWRQVLERLADQFRNHRAGLEEQAGRLTENIAGGGTRLLKIEPESDDHAAWRETTLNKLRRGYDRKHGGFGGAPKFPMSQALEALLAGAVIHRDFADLERVEHAALAMLDGGIYDHLGGGFSRYTVDGAWRVPHFEKMLYDNALLLRLLAKLHLVKPNPRYLAAIAETTAWLRREMALPEGGYQAALDADSEGVEGKYYVWDLAEIEELLTAEEARLIVRFYNLTAAGNWEEEHTNIPYRKDSLAAVAAELEVPLEQAESLLLQSEKKLHEYRFRERVHPGADDKLILQWNALLISGFCWCYRATREDWYRDEAVRLYRLLTQQLAGAEGLHRNLTTGQLGAAAFLDDYAALAAAGLDLYDVTLDLSYVLGADAGAMGDLEAVLAGRESSHTSVATRGGAPSLPWNVTDTVAYILRHFAQPDGPMFYLRPPAGSELPVDPVDLFDNALPSGNGQLMRVFLRLHRLTGNEDYRQRGENMLAAMAGSLERYPSSFGGWLYGALAHAAPGRETVVLGPEAHRHAEPRIYGYDPAHLVVAGERPLEELPLTAGRYVAGKTLLYTCEDGACRLPEELKAQR